MKEATGELNASVIVFIAVSLLAAFFFMIVWPGIKSTLLTSSNCASAVCADSNGDVTYDKKGLSVCHSASDPTGDTFTCPFRD